VCLNAMAGYTAPASQSGDGASSDTAKIIGKRRAVRSSGNAASRFDLRRGPHASDEVGVS
jgi:hypothetical protein